jgi:predicted metal-dependent hydrolase
MADPRLIAGLRRLLARKWFDAHESMEELWRETDESEVERRAALQGIIQHAVALEHLQRGNALGAFNVWSRAKGKLAKVDPWALGVGIGEWGEAIEAFYKQVNLADRVRQQLEGGIAAGEEHLDLPDLPALETWPIPPLSDDLAAACK